MTLPSSALALVERFCDEQVPLEMRDRLRVEHRVRGQTVTLVECRPSWAGDDWTEIPMAQLRHDASGGGWTLFWFDSQDRAHRYEEVAPHQPIERLLAVVDDDPFAIFKG